MGTTLNIYETRAMLQVLENRIPSRTFFRNNFFRDGQIYQAETVDLDIIKGTRRMAPFVNPKMQGKVLDKAGYTTRSYKPAYVKPKLVTTAANILSRQAGQPVYTQSTNPAVMAAQQLGRELAELDDSITRREEWMCAGALLTGKVTVLGDGVNDELDFYANVTHFPVLLTTARWSQASTAVPLTNLKTWKRIVTKDSGFNPNICVMGLDAYDAFMGTTQVTSASGLFNLRQIDIGAIQPLMLPNGITYIGRINEIGMDIYTYEEWYYDEGTSSEKPMMPADKVFLGATNTECEFCYGAIQDLDSLVPVARFPKTWKEEDPSAMFLMVQSAPMPVPKRIDAFLTATVL